MTTNARLIRHELCVVSPSQEHGGVGTPAGDMHHLRSSLRTIRTRSAALRAPSFSMIRAL
jgi:hypothetical protein